MNLVLRHCIAICFLAIVSAGSMSPMEPEAGKTVRTETAHQASKSFFALMNESQATELCKSADSVVTQMFEASVRQDCPALLKIMESLGSSTQECGAACTKILELLNTRAIGKDIKRNSHYLKVFKLLLNFNDLVDKETLTATYKDTIQYALNAAFELHENNVRLLASILQDLFKLRLQSFYTAEQQANFVRITETLVSRLISDLYATKAKEQQNVLQVASDLLDPLETSGLIPCAKELEKRINEIERRLGKQFASVTRISSTEEKELADLKKEVEEN